jgi:hypothetical protein
MGALLVVLVAVSRTARERALRASAAVTASDAIEDPKLRQTLAQIKNYQSLLTHARSEIEKKLREDQKRMSHFEGHMRKLQDRLIELQLAERELAALEMDHYDDYEQARRDLQRLEKLIADTQQAIESQKQNERGRKKSYALVPYEGPNGTLRRPIHIECRDGALFLQPEGVQITRDDLRPPLGAGNPLAAALRAARDHYVRLNPLEGRNRDSEPYPLIAVRPSGLDVYNLAQRALQSADFDFGYELFEEDSEIKYQPPDPQLAVVEQQAIDQARIRQQVLAAAAPRAFRHTGLAASGRFEVDDEPSMGFGVAAPPGGAGMESGSGEFVDEVPTDGSPADNAGGNIEGNEPQDADHQYAGAEATLRGAAGTRGPDPIGRSESSAVSVHEQDINVARAGVATGSASDGAGAVLPSVDDEAMSNVAISTGSRPPASIENASKAAKSQPIRGKDWAFRQKNPRDVPISRTISVVVRKNQLAVLSDEARSRSRRLAGKTIQVPGDTAESIDELVRVVHEQIDSWGIAGDGLCWKPVLALHVGPDGHRRAEDIARLLKDSGLETRLAATATHTSQDGIRATGPR